MHFVLCASIQAGPVLVHVSPADTFASFQSYLALQSPLWPGSRSPAAGTAHPTATAVNFNAAPPQKRFVERTPDLNDVHQGVPQLLKFHTHMCVFANRLHDSSVGHVSAGDQHTPHGLIENVKPG